MHFDSGLILEVLEGATRRVERGWTAGHQGRTESGEPVPPEHPSARRWCAFGALRVEALARFPRERSAGLLLAEAAAKVAGAMLAHLGQAVFRQSASRTLMEWNDVPERSQEEVISFYRRTAKALRRQAGSKRQAERGVGAVHAG
jgi:hypothetical protein